MPDHVLFVIGMRPFKCSICEVAFRRSDNLLRHIRGTHRLAEPNVKSLMKEVLSAVLLAKGRAQENCEIEGPDVTVISSSAQSTTTLPLW